MDHPFEGRSAGDESGVGREEPRRQGNTPLKSRNSEEVALLHEVIEGLTALGNYLVVVQHELDDPRAPRWGRLRDALAKSLDQHERARRAVRRLSDLLYRGDEDQSSFR